MSPLQQVAASKDSSLNQNVLKENSNSFFSKIVFEREREKEKKSLEVVIYRQRKWVLSFSSYPLPTDKCETLLSSSLSQDTSIKSIRSVIRGFFPFSNTYFEHFQIND